MTSALSTLFPHAIVVSLSNLHHHAVPKCNEEQSLHYRPQSSGHHMADSFNFTRHSAQHAPAPSTPAVTPLHVSTHTHTIQKPIRSSQTDPITMAETTENALRFSTEFSLLEAMYPNEITLDPKSQEVTYAPSSGASLCLRIPSTYPSSGLPDIISARGPPARRSDLRDALKPALQALPSGEEALDAIMLAFKEAVEAAEEGPEAHGDGHAATAPSTAAARRRPSPPRSARAVTTVVYLHHLLALSKRKAALAPSAPGLSGVTKPGYPGVLVYAGPEAGVRAHVRALREMNWQAFQVRAEEEGAWRFAHGEGVREVESMAEVVAAIEEGRREAFLGAMRMR